MRSLKHTQTVIMPETWKIAEAHQDMPSCLAVVQSHGLPKKQPVVTLSTTEAEFISAAACACQAIWMRRILGKLNHGQREGTIIHCDNSSAIKLSRNPVLHGRSKHIDVRFHFLRDLTKEGTVKLVHCSSQAQIADIMTKPLKLESFEKLREKLGMCVMPRLN